MSNETTVGQIVAYLRMDASQWNAEIDKADAKADELGRKDPKIRITTNAAQAIAQLESVAAAQRRLSDASDRVRLAQVRLTEVQSDGSAKASKLLAAEQALAKAIRDEESATGALTAAKARSIVASDKLTDSNKKTEDASKKASQGMGLLGTAIVALGPATVPVAAGTAGLAAGYSAMGAVGILALVGIKQQMAAGTTLGRAYSAQVGILQRDLHSLSGVAAGGVLTPFQQSVAQLQADMPNLTHNVGEFSIITGKTAGNLVSGLLAAFVALEPVMQDVGVYTLHLSQRFDGLMHGGGVTEFGSYVRSVFPQVMTDVESLVGAVIHLVQSLAPLGGGVLSEIGMLSSAISAIPLDVLTVVAGGAQAAYLGFKGYQLISGWVEGLGRALRFLGASEDVAAAGMRGLNMAAGVIGLAVTALSVIMSANAEQTRQNQQAANDFTDALLRTNGVIDDSIRLDQAKKFSTDGVLEAAKSLGIAQADMVNAALGQPAAIQRVNDALAAQQTAIKKTSDVWYQGAQSQNTALGGFATTQQHATGVTAQYAAASSKVLDAIASTNSALAAGRQGYRDITAATTGSVVAADAQTQAQSLLAASLGTTLGSIQAAQTAQSNQAKSTADATAQMQLQNDAAGLLKQALDILNGKALTAADAQNAFDASLVNMGSHMTASGGKVKNTTTNINAMTAGSVALRGELNAQVKNLQNVVEANGGLQGSTAKSRAQMATLRQEIIDNAVAHGVNRQAVTRYIDKLLAIPKKIPPTRLDVDTSAAMVKLHVMQSAINSITGKTVSIYTNQYINSVAVPTANAARTANQYALGNAYSSTPAARNTSSAYASKHLATGGDVPGYAGGTLIGPGSGMSDSIMAMVAQTSQLVRLSTGEFVSTSASRSRNRAALEAGNRGAQLEVAGQGLVELGDATIARLARAISNVTLHPTISAGSVDRALAGMRR